METPTDPSTLSAPVQHAYLNRQVDLDITLDQLWSLVSEPSNLRAWLADDINLDMSPGSVGTVVDDGEIRHVRIDRVVQGRRLEFCWWPADEPSDVSAVVFQIEEMPSGSSRLKITETLFKISGLEASSLGNARGTGSELTSVSRWEIRVLSLWACTVAMALVQ